MNQNKFNFESESFTVDFITINISGPVDVDPIAKYLFKHCHFNSMLEGTGRKKFLYSKSTNPYKVSFRTTEYNPSEKLFWSGTQVIFSGDNAAQLYKLIKTQKFQWDILNLEKVNIGRFDIHYFLENDFPDRKNLVENFFLKSREHALAAGVHATSDSKILKIGHRKSPNHYRVYLKEKIVRKSLYDQLVYGLEFELELKGNNIKKLQKLLLSNSLVDIQKFENHLSHHFLRYSLTRLDLTTSCTNWLLDSYRRKIRPQSSEHLLAIDYLKKTSLKNFAEKDSFFRLLQLLSFIRAEQLQPLDEDTFFGETYFRLQFPLYKFIKFIGMDALGGKGQARRIKVRESLMSLAQVKPLVNHFSLDEFESLPIIGPLKVLKEGKFLMVTISILKPIYDYQYPFVLPRSFLFYESRYDLYIKIEILRVLATMDRKKFFHLENFLNQFSVSNRKKKEMKILLLKYLNELKEFIQPTFSIEKKNGNIIETKELTLTLIQKAKIISFNEAIIINTGKKNNFNT